MAVTVLIRLKLRLDCRQLWYSAKRIFKQQLSVPAGVQLHVANLSRSCALSVLSPSSPIWSSDAKCHH